MALRAAAALLLPLLLLLIPTPGAAQPAHQVLAYYVPYDPTSWASLQAHPEGIDYLGLQWVTVDGCGQLTTHDDQTLKAFARDHGIKLLPSLLTSSAWLNHRLLSDDDDSQAGPTAIAQIVEYVLAEGYDGL